MDDSEKHEDRASLDDFRASAAAFSQLTGVLGGFCITFLALALDSETLGQHESAKDWLAGLTLIAALSYVFAAGIFANSMNSLALRASFTRRGRLPRAGIFAFQRKVFGTAVGAFHVGNVFLAGTLISTSYQFSLRVGLAATVLVAVVVIYMFTINLHASGLLSHARRLRSRRRIPRRGGDKTGNGRDKVSDSSCV